MAKSMTGYGRGEFHIGGEHFSVEAKSLNHRFLDVSLRMHERFNPLEAKIRDEVKKRFSRGSFTIFINLMSAETPPLKLNIPMARLYLEAAEELKKELGVGGDANIATLLKMKDIFTFERRGPLTESDWEPVKEGLEKAFEQLTQWRIKEGENLRGDLCSKIDSLEGLVFHVESRAPKVVEEYRERLRADMEEILKGRVEEARLLQEAALFAERTDINEEIVRLKSHIELFRKFLKFEEPIGKRLDFLCQEIGREINTIGSKSNDVRITQTVIELKGEAEKIREQVQNVE